MNTSRRDLPFRYAIVLSLLTCFWERFAPYATHSLGQTPFASAYQSFFVSFFWMTPGVLLGVLSTSIQGRTGKVERATRAMGLVAITLAPFFVLADSLVSPLLGAGLFSNATWNAIVQSPGWWSDVGIGTIRNVITHFLTAAVIVAIGLATATRWNVLPNRDLSQPVIVGLSLVTALAGYAIHRKTTRDHLAGVVLSKPWAVDTMASDDPPIDAMRWMTANSVRRFTPNVMPGSELGESGESSPDIVLVIIESFRHELISAEVMPTLHAAAQEGLWFTNHFSSGNATNHGFFSLFNGVDATRFDDRSRRFDPLLPRLFRQAGYQVGFFSGDHDWERFEMHGIIDPDDFDVFQVSPGGSRNAKSLAADHAAAASLVKFLAGERPAEEDAFELPLQSRPPRLGVLYLYATHAPYRYYPRLEAFRPSARDGYAIPYARLDIPLVWNRYRNAARTVDHWLAPIIDSPDAFPSVSHSKRRQRDRIIFVTGDHGESFTEDGKMLHGTGISVVQNSTPLVICGRSSQLEKAGKPQTVKHLTYHPDVLPTMLSLAGISINANHVAPGDSLFDGIVIARAS